jgi:integrase
MAGGINRLTDPKIRAFLRQAKAGTAPVKKLFDGGGMFLMVTPAGTAVWRLKYSLGGKSKLYAIGVYPDVSLAGARAQRDAAKALLSEGRDPVMARMLQRAGAMASGDSTFAGAAETWLAKMKPGWSAIHYTKSKQALERDVLPFIGKLPVGSITAPMVTAVIDRVVARGAVETASKILWNIRCIFNEAKARTEGLPENPAEPVRETLPKRTAQKKRPALLTFEALGDLLRGADMAHLSPAVRMAHRLVAFSTARIGNVITAEWSEFDLDGDTPSWTIPRAKMKMKDRDFDHKVILGPTITAELSHWRRATGGAGYAFPSPVDNGKHITHESLEKVYRVTLKLDGKHSPHGWRSAFSTLAKENEKPFSRESVELALDHVADNAIVRAYDRGQRLEERVRLAYWWDAQLSAAQRGTDPIPFRATRAAG